jgi:hypothetical protein
LSLWAAKEKVWRAALEVGTLAISVRLAKEVQAMFVLTEKYLRT